MAEVREEAVEKKLYDAALSGDLPTFQQLLRGNMYLLDVVSFAGSRNLLHLAISWGQAAIVEEVLRIHPLLAQSSDSQNSSPLHIAAALGHTEIATQLSSVAPEMCWWRDCQGMNPIHVAAMNGHVEILQVLTEVDLTAAMEKAECGQTVLHLCVKHHQLRALTVLAEKLGENFVLTSDDNQQTLLHLAARNPKFEMIKFLVENTKIEMQSMDSMRRTAMDILKGSPQEIKDLFWNRKWLDVQFKMDGLNDGIMIVMVLIATMAFQAIVSPPGGVWQDNSSTHKAGKAVMATTYPEIYKTFVHDNSVAFFLSLILILMLANKLLSRYNFIYPTILGLMCLPVMFIARSYGAAIRVISPNKTDSLKDVTMAIFFVTLGLFGFLGFLVFKESKFFMKIKRYLRALRQSLQQWSS